MRVSRLDLEAGVWEAPVSFGALHPPFPGTVAAQRVEGCGHHITPNILQPRLHLSNPNEMKIKGQTTKSGPEPPPVCVDKPASGQEAVD